MIRHLGIAALIWVVALPAFAADAAGNYAIWGAGRASCFQYTKSTKNDEDPRFKVYLMGYLTAFNTLSDDTYNATGSRSLTESLDWLTEYCGAHQMDSYDRAIQQMLDQTFSERQTVPPGHERGWGRAGAGVSEPTPTQE